VTIPLNSDSHCDEDMENFFFVGGGGGGRFSISVSIVASAGG